MYSFLGPIIFMLLYLINVISHSLALHLLTCLKRNGMKNVDFIYQTNLCVINLMMFAIGLARYIFIRISKNGEQFDRINNHLFIIVTFLFVLVYMMTKVFILLNKLFEIKLNILYPIYWNNNKTKISILMIWTFAFIGIAITTISYHFRIFSFKLIYPVYILVPVTAVYILVAVSSTAYIFYKYNKLRLLPCVYVKRQVTVSFWAVFLRSRFFIPILLTGTFTLFNLIPLVIVAYINVTNPKDDFITVVKRCILISILFDSIGVFLDRNVKRFVRKKIRDRRLTIEINAMKTRGKNANRNTWNENV